MRGSILGISFLYAQQRKNSIRYRRPVPPELQTIIGKGEITRALGASKKEATRNWGAVHREVEDILAAARRTLLGQTGSTEGLGDSDWAEYKRLERRFRAAGIDPREIPTEDPDTDTVSPGILLADQLVGSFPIDPKTGDPLIPAGDMKFIRALNKGLGREPVPTLKEAAKLYVDEKAAGVTRKAKADRQRVDRVMAVALNVLGGDRPVDHIRRRDAEQIRDQLLAAWPNRASARRHLAPLKALGAYALWKTEHDKDVTDPFSGVTIVVDGNPVDNRRPFSTEELAAIREHIRRDDRLDLFDIWTVLEFTGCRLSEVRGLDRKDVFLDASVPHIRVRWTDDRRLKTKVSDRDVPLHLEAIAALRRALGRSKASPHVFPAYMHDGGADDLSRHLMGHVRAIAPDPLAVTHSLRHNMEDRLLIAHVPPDLSDRFLGHGGSEHKMRRHYGGREALLRVKAEALTKAFPEIAPSAPQEGAAGPSAALL